MSCVELLRPFRLRQVCADTEILNRRLSTDSVQRSTSVSGTGPLSQRSAIAKVRYRKGPGLGLGLGLGLVRVRVSLPLTPTI